MSNGLVKGNGGAWRRRQSPNTQASSAICCCPLPICWKAAGDSTIWERLVTAGLVAIFPFQNLLHWSQCPPSAASHRSCCIFYWLEEMSLHLLLRRSQEGRNPPLKTSPYMFYDCAFSALRDFRSIWATSQSVGGSLSQTEKGMTNSPQAINYWESVWWKHLQQIDVVEKYQYSFIYINPWHCSLVKFHSSLVSTSVPQSWGRVCGNATYKQWGEERQGCSVVRGGSNVNANSHPATREMSSRSNPWADSSDGAATRSATTSGGRN